MKKKPDESTRVFGSDVLLQHLASILKEIDGVRNPKDIESIHNMRVAIRRFRSTLPLFESCYSTGLIKKWMADTAQIGKTLGQARDTDVKIEKLTSILVDLPNKRFSIGIHRLMVRLRQARASQQEKIIKALDRIEEKGVLPAIQGAIEKSSPHPEDPVPFSARLYQTAYGSIEGYRDSLLKYDEIVDKPENKEELHAMRIAAKRLRYAMEAFAPLYPMGLSPFIKTTRKIQDQLGDIHDFDVWEVFLQTYRNEETQRTLDYFGYVWPINKHWPGIEYLANYFDNLRDSGFQLFQNNWKEWNSDKSWEKLHEVISVPVSLLPEVYPPAPMNLQVFDLNAPGNA